jgi:trimeric autotransporter adhesin
MTISTTTIKNSYNGNGSTSAFNYTFKISAESEMQVIIRSAAGTETVKTLTTHYTISGVGNAGGGAVTFTAGNIPVTGETVILRRDTAQTQAMDLIDNDPMSADTIENAHDKSIAIAQELQEEVDRSIKLSRTNTMTSTEFTVDAADRANKVLSFDASGEIAVTQELGTFKGNSATTTTAAYVVRDIVKSTTTAQLNNIYICIQASPIGTALTNTAYWTLIVDAVSAATSATNAAASEAAAANSATDAETAQTAAELAETNAETAETNAETAETNAATSETNAAASETAAAASETNAATSEANAATSESNASTSASTATTQASNASTSATNAANSAAAAATSESNASTSESNASTSETNAASSASTASTQASNAATSATNAASSATAASNAQTSVENIFDNFDDRFLGTKTSDPTVDNDGNALSVGAVYYNSSANSVRFYNGSSWDAPATSAATSATNAANSASAASTSETNAASSASTASTQATNAATSATNAATSETNAASSATSAASSASTATTKASEASTSASNASTSETNAATSATSASGSATTATTQATNASNSASAASTSESNASTSETNAATSETNAAASETAAATSETNAASSATNASNSATAAATSANNAATSATNAAASAVDATNNGAAQVTLATNQVTLATTQATNAANSATTATTQATTATTKASEASTSATNAANSASTASTQATNASNSASAASTSESNASSSASSALSYKNAAETALDTFDDRFLGAKSSDPSTDNDGDTLIDGALYFDSTNNLLKVYDLGNTQWNRTIPTSSDQTKINTVSGIASDVTDVANIAADVTTTANNVSGINSFAERYRVASSDPTTSLDAGDLAFNTSGNVLKYYDGSSWQGITAGGITDIAQDSTPELGGDLGLNSNNITGTGNINITGNISLTGTVDSRDIATDGTKLDGIESGATADQTNAEIKTAYEANSNTNVFLDAEKTKLTGIETNATADQTASEILTAVKTVDGASSGLDADLLDGQHGSYYTQYADTAVSNLVASAPAALDTLNELAAALGDDANFATTTATSLGEKLPKSGGTMTGTLAMGSNTITTSSTVDGRDISADGTKLDTIETNATADQTDAEIKTAYENNSNTNAFTDALQTKLNNASTLTGTETLTNKTLTLPKINEDVALTSTATELNLLDGVSGLVQADFTKLAAVSSTADELNLLDGVSGLVQADFTKLAAIDSTAAELNYSDLATLGTTAASKVFTADANNLTKVSGAVANVEDTLTDGATITWNVIDSPVAKVTLAGNRTLSAPSGTTPIAGQFVSLLIIQDGTGGRTITWNAAYEFAADTAPTLTATANLGDLFTFRYNGTKWLEIGRNLALTLS